MHTFKYEYCIIRQRKKKGGVGDDEEEVEWQIGKTVTCSICLDDLEAWDEKVRVTHRLP